MLTGTVNTSCVRFVHALLTYAIDADYVANDKLSLTKGDSNKMLDDLPNGSGMKPKAGSIWKLVASDFEASDTIAKFFYEWANELFNDLFVSGTY